VTQRAGGASWPDGSRLPQFNQHDAVLRSCPGACPTREPLCLPRASASGAQRPGRAQAMSMAEGIAVIVSAIVPLIVALTSLLWWAYRRGEAAGMEKAAGKAKIEALERLLTETRAELASLQPRRWR
jgi:hypothetical protein